MQRERDELEDNERAAHAPDKEKLIALADELANLRIPPVMESVVATRLAYTIGMKIDALVQWIKAEAVKL